MLWDFNVTNVNRKNESKASKISFGMRYIQENGYLRKHYDICTSDVTKTSNIYIFIAIALDESIFLDVLHFPMKNIKSRDLDATPMGGATSKPIQ